MYVVDTNVYLDWWDRRYPSFAFPTFQSRVDALIAAGRWVSVKGVFDEIGHVGSPGLKLWAKAQSAHFRPHDAALLTQANAITKAHPGLIDTSATYDEADRYVIALAKMNKWCVVTHETPARRKGLYAPRTDYMPDVCAKMGVKCLELLTILRNEKLTFH